MPRSRILLYLGAILLLLGLSAAWYALAFTRDDTALAAAFDGKRALADVQRQVDFGPRIPGSEAHAQTLDWMQAELEAAGWSTQRQSTTAMGHPIINLIASRNSEPPVLIIGAHYDTRLQADRDPKPEMRSGPGPGANDGASGVAVLLELARTLPLDAPPTWLVFFDAEDNGRIPGWDWILGSRAFVAGMSLKPQKMVLVDMVGDRELDIEMEGASDPQLLESIWATAARLGHGDVFLHRPESVILDDHVPFLQAGIPAVDIIDIDYAYWHTTADTVDKLSSQSLQTVGDVLWAWIVAQGTGAPSVRTP